MRIDRLDHFVLTVADIDASCAFYSRVLGMQVVEFENGRKALVFGRQKINLHRSGAEYVPHADRPTPGSADVCLITTTPLTDALVEVKAHGIAVIKGPVERTGATGPISSFYFRDPDGNLIEVSNYADA